MVKIESAYFGDEKSSRNVTDPLIGKVASGSLNTKVDESLIPQIETSTEVKLSIQDEKQVREDSVKTCGEADQECIKTTSSRLRQERLAAKQRQGSDDDTLKGRRLTVNLIDDNGQTRKVVVPDGQTLKLEDVQGKPLVPKGSVFPSTTVIQDEILMYVGFVIAGFFYVISIALGVKVFGDEYRLSTNVKYLLVAVFALIPYSGFISVFVYYIAAGGLGELFK